MAKKSKKSSFKKEKTTQTLAAASIISEQPASQTSAETNLPTLIELNEEFSLLRELIDDDLLRLSSLSEASADTVNTERQAALLKLKGHHANYERLSAELKKVNPNRPPVPLSEEEQQAILEQAHLICQSEHFGALNTEFENYQQKNNQLRLKESEIEKSKKKNKDELESDRVEIRQKSQELNKLREDAHKGFRNSFKVENKELLDSLKDREKELDNREKNLDKYESIIQQKIKEVYRIVSVDHTVHSDIFETFSTKLAQRINILKTQNKSEIEDLEEDLKSEQRKRITQVQTKQTQLDELNKIADDLREQQHKLQRENTQIRLKLSQQTQEEIREELELLKMEKEQLQIQLEALQSKMDHMQQEHAQEEKTNRNLLQATQNELDVIKRDYLRAQYQQLNLSNLQFENQKLKDLMIKYKVLHEEVHQTIVDTKLETFIESLQQIQAFSVQHSNQVFPTLNHMDQSEIHQQAQAKYDETPPNLATQVKEAMAADPDPRFYHENDIRAFFASMATSRLIILQGPSGIGKTSLPEYLARVCGGGSKIVSVQSGWRDRSDLMGYYNSFEKKYNESDFLCALYEAQTPKYRHSPCFLLFSMK